MVNIDQFGAINNNFSLEIADEMFSNLTDKIFTAFSDQTPQVFRSSGGQLMIFLERDVTSDEIDSLGKNLLSTVNTIADPEDPDLRKMANLAVMSAAVSNEVRYFERLIKPGPRQSTEGLGDIFISQVNSIPLTEGQTIGNYMSTMKARCHSNPDSTVFRVRDESDHLIFTEFHQPAKNIPKN